MVSLESAQYEVSDFGHANDLIQSKGWGDGFPVVPPTADWCPSSFLLTGLAPDVVVGEMAERASKVTVEKLAINSVMAGCSPDLAPILVAVIQAVSDEHFHFNVLASMGSPWPLIVVNGPIVNKVGLNTGLYMFGPGQASRGNATIARAVSLTLANCAQARVEDIQRGSVGQHGALGRLRSRERIASLEPATRRAGIRRVR